MSFWPEIFKWRNQNFYKGSYSYLKYIEKDNILIAFFLSEQFQIIFDNFWEQGFYSMHFLSQLAQNNDTQW